MPHQHPLFYKPVQIDNSLLITTSCQPCILGAIDAGILLQILIQQLPALLHAQRLIGRRSRRRCRLRTTLQLHLTFQILIELPAQTEIQPTQSDGGSTKLFLVRRLAGTTQRGGEVTQFAQLHRPAIGKAVAQLVHKACHRSFQQAAAEAGEKMYTLDKFLAVDGALGDKAGLKGLLLAGLADVGFLEKVVIRTHIYSVFKWSCNSVISSSTALRRRNAIL